MSAVRPRSGAYGMGSHQRQSGSVTDLHFGLARDGTEMSSSPSPSSSAVTIPTPGKSILKRPPPQQQSFFSLGRLSKLLPTQNAAAPNDSNDESRTLKRAHFILPEMTTVYPIYATNPPCTPTMKEEKRSIEEKEAERRKRVVRRNSVNPDSAPPEEQWWSVEQVESFYRECCVGREEAPDPGISAAILVRRLGSSRVCVSFTRGDRLACQRSPPPHRRLVRRTAHPRLRCGAV